MNHYAFQQLQTLTIHLLSSTTPARSIGDTHEHPPDECTDEFHDFPQTSTRALWLWIVV
jgi:hypothetical protein